MASGGSRSLLSPRDSGQEPSPHAADIALLNSGGATPLDTHAAAREVVQAKSASFADTLSPPVLSADSASFVSRPRTSRLAHHAQVAPGGHAGGSVLHTQRERRHHSHAPERRAPETATPRWRPGEPEASVPRLPLRSVASTHHVNQTSHDGEQDHLWARMHGEGARYDALVPQRRYQPQEGTGDLDSWTPESSSVHAPMVTF